MFLVKHISKDSEIYLFNTEQLPIIQSLTVYFKTIYISNTTLPDSIQFPDDLKMFLMKHKA